MEYTFDWSVIFQYREQLLQGVLATLQLSVLATLLSLTIGTLVGTARFFLSRPLALPFVVFTEVFRNIPPIVQFFFWYFAAGLDGLPAGVIGLSIFASSHVAELVRAGLSSIPRTQLEAARSSGLSFFQAVSRILLPQAFLRITPALSSEIVNIVKDSAIAMTIGYADLSFQAAEIEARTFRGFEAATAATLLYAAIGTVILVGMHALEFMLRRNVRIG